VTLALARLSYLYSLMRGNAALPFSWRDAIGVCKHGAVLIAALMVAVIEQ
jgi:hypothetical protein